MSISTRDDDASWILFTMHKAASTYVGSLLQGIFSDCGYVTHDPAALAFEAGLDEVAFCKSQRELFLQSKAYFGPFRTETAAAVSDFPSLRSIVHIRDPRDCVVSMYYSYAFSHPVPGPGPLRDQFLDNRRRFQAMSVDDFALEGLRNGYDALGIMHRIVLLKPDAIVSKYEDMVTRFDHWMSDLVERIGLPVSPRTLTHLTSQASFEVTEDSLQHKRQVTPGDFRRKLSRKVQSRLTDALRKDLIAFGYL